jgi:rhodanese-related sulfurtransferase
MIRRRGASSNEARLSSIVARQVDSTAGADEMSRWNADEEGRIPMRVHVVAMVVLVAFLAPFAVPAHADAEAPSITPSALATLRASGSAPVVIDVRTPAEYATGHIPGAINIPYDQVADRIAEIDAPNGVALYCMLGPRARKGETALLDQGYTSVLHLEGGLAAWQAAGLPVADGPAVESKP